MYIPPKRTMYEYYEDTINDLIARAQEAKLAGDYLEFSDLQWKADFLTEYRQCWTIEDAEMPTWQ